MTRLQGLGVSALDRRRLAGMLLGSLGVALGAGLALATSGCEAILGTGDLQDEVAGTDGAPPGDDDDDDPEASVYEAGTDASGLPDSTTPREGGTLDGGDGGRGGDGGADAGDASDGGDGGDGSSGEGGVGPYRSCLASSNASAQTCGPQESGDCCATAPVTGDFYFRSFDEAGDMGAPVNVSTYYLDLYEVTVGRMRAYAGYLAGGGPPPAARAGIHTHLNAGRGLLVVPSSSTIYESGWSTADNGKLTLGASASASFASTTSCPATTYTALAGPSDNRPVNCVSWYDAYAFCIWDGGFLPTEAEWELAAVSGSEQVAYPWGDAPAPQAGYAVFNCNASATCPSVVGTAASGAAISGQVDLLGNVAEWTLDDYSVTAFSDSEDCHDCAELSTGLATKVDRGGAYSDTLASGYISSQNRGNLAPAGHSALAGFRCARAAR